VQLEDKVVEDYGAARAEAQQREDVLAHGEEQLPETVAEAVTEASVQVRGKLLGAVRMVLADQQVRVGELRLPTREAHALEALQVAVSGRNELNAFIYATDRRDLLEQALAVLQPDLIHTDAKTAHELHAQLSELTARVGALRHTLTNLEDAQDELVEVQQKATLEQGEPDDKPKPSPLDPDAPRPATTLTGPERPEASPPPTTLVGPELPEPRTPPTTLVGPELPEPRTPPTTLVGPELPEPRTPPTTLVGPELPEPRTPPTTLGDPAELAERAKQPWWRRPFG
jgi:hypothetical protein